MNETSRLTIAQAATLVARFAEYPCFPALEAEAEDPRTGETRRVPGPGQAALIRAFQTVSKSITHGERITVLLEDGCRCGDDANASRFCPKPADVYYAAQVLASSLPEFTFMTVARCSACQDTRWISRHVRKRSSIAGRFHIHNNAPSIPTMMVEIFAEFL